MLTRRELLTLCAAAPALTRTVRGQDVQFSTGVRVVNILATVRDRNGKIVTNLTQDDFVLEEDGVPREIRYFARESDLPLTIGLLVDISGSMAEEIDDIRRASRQFLRQVLREDRDRAFLIQFARQVELQQELTSSRRALDDAANRIGGRGGFRLGAGSAIQDAIFQGADDILRDEEGRKALILLSDGGENGSRMSLASAIEIAQRADALIYTIRFYEQPGGFFSRLARATRRGPTPMEAAQMRLMGRLASETGGESFERSEMPLSDIYGAIEEELRHQYSIGFTPSSDRPGYRRIRLAAKRPGLTVRTREGYYAA